MLRPDPAPVICPYRALERFATGLLKFTWLNRLKNSARNWRRWPSSTLMSFRTARSVDTDAGPEKRNAWRRARSERPGSAGTSKGWARHPPSVVVELLSKDFASV